MIQVFNKLGELKVTHGTGGGGGGVSWGAITGTITDQTDLVSYVAGLPISTFTNDSNYIVIGDVTSLPISTFTNDSGYLTSFSETDPIFNAWLAGPPNISDFTNDAGYITSTGITPAALTRTNDTNVTLTLSGTPTTALLQAVGLTLGWTGTLADARITSASTWNAKQDALVGTGFVKSTAGTISYDNSTYQPLDSDLTTIAGLIATTDNFIVSVGSAWSSRTPTQVKTTLSLNNVDNTSDTNKPVSTATQTALNLKDDKQDYTKSFLFMGA